MDTEYLEMLDLALAGMTGRDGANDFTDEQVQALLIAAREVVLWLLES